MGWDVTAMGQNVTDVGCEKKESKKELKKHAATIHCSNSLSLLQRKITNALLYHAYKELMLKDEHEITVKQLCRLIGYQGNNHSAIKEAFKDLLSTVIEWNLINDETGTENWTASSILASVSLEGPLCYYAYSPRMKQLLHSPSMFGKIDLVIQSRFRSSYGLALYENCTRYRGLPHTKWFDMELFKKLMGVPAGKYDVFRDFKRRVLDKAVEEVNTYSDLVIESEFVREGRKVIKVRFKLKERAKKTRLGSNKNTAQLGEDSSQLKKKLLETFRLSEEQIEQLFSEHDTQFILDKIAVIEDSKPFQEGKVQNLAGYLLSAVKNNYQPAKNKQNQVIDLQDAKFELELSELKRQVEGIRNAYQMYRERLINERIQSLEQNQKKEFLEQFYQFAEPVVKTILQLQRKYTRETVLDSPQVKALLRQFALREIDMLNVPSLEEFVAQLDGQQIEVWQKFKSFDPDHVLLRFSE
jgi:plasmid replication initiation protein